MSRGYLFLTFGQYYVEELLNLVKMIRKTGDSLPIITFNYHSDIKLPSKIQTFGRHKNPNSKELYDYIPFVHMLKPHRDLYFKLVNRILEI